MINNCKNELVNNLIPANEKLPLQISSPGTYPRPGNSNTQEKSTSKHPLNGPEKSDEPEIYNKTKNASGRFSRNFISNNNRDNYRTKN